MTLETTSRNQLAYSKILSVLKSERRKVILFTQVKNEAPYVREWVFYHKMLGFTDIFILDNDSTDETPAILRRLESNGDVHHIVWPRVDENERPQLVAFELFQKANLEAQPLGWVLFSDVDEFLSLRRHKDVFDLISEYGEYDAVALNWRIFGSSGYTTRPSGLVISSYLQRAYDSFPANRHVKTFVNLRKLRKFLGNSHYVSVEDASKYVFPDKTIFPMGFDFKAEAVTRPGNYADNLNIACINHYLVKSKEDWEQKMARGRVSAAKNSVSPIDDRYFKIHDQNAVRDEYLASFCERVMQRLNFFCC